MAVLDTNVLNATAGEISLTTESVVTLYVLAKTGDHDRHRVILQASPTASGGNWRRAGSTVRGAAIKTYTIAAERVRAKVVRPEGSTSTCDVFVIAR